MLVEERRKTGHYKTVFSTVMETIIKDKMVNHQWSPEQIVGWCRSQTIKMVSHERTYHYVLKDKQAGGLLFKHLRIGQKVYNKTLRFKRS